MITTCPNLTTLQALLDGELDQNATDSVKSHIENECCTECRRNLDALRIRSIGTVNRGRVRIAKADAALGENDWWNKVPAGHYVPDIAGDPQYDGPLSERRIELHTSLIWKNRIEGGGQGDVHVYEDETVGRKVAVKFIKESIPFDLENQASLRRRFARECLITAKLEHPGVAPLYAIGTFSKEEGLSKANPLGTTPAYAMRFVNGETLDARIKCFHAKHGVVSKMDNFLKLIGSFQTICRTIEHAHQRGISHGDLKPANVMVNKDVTVVVDWGCARFESPIVGPLELDDAHDPAAGIHEAISAFATTGSGTPEYMAPEQALQILTLNEDTLDHKKIDVFLLGAILFEITTGESPHQKAKGETISAFLQRIAKQSAPDADLRRREQSPHVPDDRRALLELNSICKRAMNPDPGKRYESAEKMVEDVEHWREGKEVAAHTYTRSERLLRLGRKYAERLVAAVVVAVSFTLFSAVFAAMLMQQTKLAQESEKEAERQTAIAVQQTERAQEQTNVANREKLRADERASQIEAFSMDATLRAVRAGDLAAFDKSGELPLSDTWEARYLKRLASIKPQQLSTFTTGTWGVLDAALHQDEKRLLAADASGRLTLWDRSSGKVTRQWGAERIYPAYKLPLHHFHARDMKVGLEKWGRCVCAVEWVGDTDQFVTASTDGRGLLGDAMSGEERPLLESARALLALGMNTAGTAALFGSADGHIYLRATKEGPALDRKVSEAAISQIRWHNEAQQWLVGDESGQLHVLQSEDLSEAATLKFDQPIWALDIGDSDQGTFLAVAGEERGIRLMKWKPDDRQWKDHVVLEASVTGRTSKVQRLRFAPGAKELFALSQDGVLSAWRLEDRSVVWTVTTSRADDRRVQLFQELSGQQPPFPIPLAFRRVGAAILTLVDKRRILTAGDDARICLWDLPSTQGLGVNSVSERVGPQPQIAFDTAADPKLWALDQQGELSVMEASSGRVIARRRAHAGQRAAIVSLPKNQGIVTVGGDELVKFWRLRGREIVPTGKELRNDQPLISVAVSADGALIATMDVRSQLCVWERKTGSVVFKDSLRTGNDDAPWTGKVAFNKDTTFLAAFGPGQSGFVYVIRNAPWNFRRLSDQLLVAGPRGGSALLWNPAIPNAVLHADDHPRLHSGAFGDPDAGKEFHFDWPESTCVALQQASDGERIISLETGGRIVFHSSRWQHKMFELKGNIHQGVDHEAVDLAVDPQGRWLAVANKQGEVELWDSGARVVADSGIHLDEAATKWKASDLLERSSAVQRIAERTLQLDSQGRLCFLSTMSLPGDVRNDGLLQFVREERGQTLREPLTPGNPEFVRRMDSTAASLALTAENEPVIVFRCRTAASTFYDGIFYAAQRTAPGKWLYEKIHDKGNLGFTPALLLTKDGTPHDIFHFSYDSFGLLHSRRQADGSWSPEVLGRQGDGMHLQSRSDRDGKLHLLFRINRFNGDPIPMGYMVWDPQNGEQTREVLVGVGDVGGMLELTTDGNPVVLRRRFDPNRRASEQWLVQRTGEGWRDYQRLPVQDSSTWKVGPDGATYLIEWNKARQELSLLRGIGDNWQRRVVGTLGSNTVAISSTILFDRAGHPVIFVASPPAPYGWAKVFREELQRVEP